MKRRLPIATLAARLLVAVLSFAALIPDARAQIPDAAMAAGLGIIGKMTVGKVLDDLN